MAKRILLDGTPRPKKQVVRATTQPQAYPRISDPRPGLASLGPLEIEILDVLWDEGPSRLSSIHARINLRRYSSGPVIATVLTRLARRGLVDRARDDSGSLYKPLVSRAAVGGAMLDAVIDRIFPGDVGAAVEQLQARCKGHGTLDPGTEAVTPSTAVLGSNRDGRRFKASACSTLNRHERSSVEKRISDTATSRTDLQVSEDNKNWLGGS